MDIRDLTYVGEGLIPAPLYGPALRYVPLPKGAVTDIAVHHMTGWNPPPDATVEQEIRFLQGIDKWHRSSRGLDGIGYHIVPMASRRIYIVSRLDRYGAGVGYENGHLLHLALPGDYTSQLPTPEHLAAAVAGVRVAYDHLEAFAPTTPHLYWGGTTCPGARWREWVPQLRAAALEEEEMDQAEFNKMYAEAVKDALVVARDDDKNPIGGLHTVGYYLYCVRQLQAQAKAAGIKRGDTVKLV